MSIALLEVSKIAFFMRTLSSFGSRQGARPVRTCSLSENYSIQSRWPQKQRVFHDEVEGEKFEGIRSNGVY